MLFPFRFVLIGLALVTGVITSYTVFADESTEIYDRLDGKGPSGKKVDVIEWEGNLEVHAYPRTSLKGLSAKLDDRTEGKKVMVIGYRFAGKPLIRRAILGIPFTSKLKAYMDPTEPEFDKLALTNGTLTAPWVPYKLEPAPAQWYPDGDERNGETTTPPVLGENKQETPSNRAPASVPSTVQKRAAPKTESVDTDNDGSVGHFNF